MQATTCNECNRCLWEKDKDKDGLCPDCAAVAKPKAEKKVPKSKFNGKDD